MKSRNHEIDLHITGNPEDVYAFLIKINPFGGAGYSLDEEIPVEDASVPDNPFAEDAVPAEEEPPVEDVSKQPEPVDETPFSGVPSDLEALTTVNPSEEGFPAPEGPSEQKEVTFGMMKDSAKQWALRHGHEYANKREAVSYVYKKLGKSEDGGSRGVDKALYAEVFNFFVNDGVVPVE